MKAGPHSWLHIDCQHPPADRIIVIEGGKIAEQGTHADCFVCADITIAWYTQQFRHELKVQYGVVMSRLPDFGTSEVSDEPAAD